MCCSISVTSRRPRPGREFTSPVRVICPVYLRIRKMLADLKVFETSHKDDERTVEKIKGVSLIGKESRCTCR